jgi:hypothetical protein
VNIEVRTPDGVHHKALLIRTESTVLVHTEAGRVAFCGTGTPLLVCDAEGAHGPIIYDDETLTVSDDSLRPLVVNTEHDALCPSCYPTTLQPVPPTKGGAAR